MSEPKLEKKKVVIEKRIEVAAPVESCGKRSQKAMNWRAGFLWRHA
jgi:hypothetical protein